MAHPKTVTVSDKTYTAEEAERISRLRQERWGLLAQWAEMPNGKRGDSRRWKRMEVRYREIEGALYVLTGNQIYNGKR